ncbi:hypothetical protein Tco_0828433 [Tanacetum coccineum]
MDSLQQDSCELKSEEFVIFDEETVIEGRSVEDLFGILCEEIRAKMVSITVKQTAKVLRAERMNMGVREMVGPQRFRVMPLMDVSFPHFAADVDFGEEDDSDTEEEAKEEEAIDKKELAPPVSNQVKATT